MAGIRAILFQAINYATDHPGLTHEDVKKIRMTNVACGVQFLNLLSLVFILLAFDVHSFFPVWIVEFIGWCACLYLLGKAQFTLAKTVLYVPILFAVVVACAGFDERLQVIVYGFPLTFALFLLYGRSESRVMYTLVIISMITLIGGNIVAGFVEPLFIVPNTQFLPPVVITMALSLAVLIVKGFFDESYRAEQKYIRAAQVISEQKERLQSVFDSVEEIILVVGPNGRIQEGFSRFTTDIIQRPAADIVGQNAFDLLVSAAHHDRDEIDQCRQALEMSLGADELQWQLNEDKILRELEYTFSGQRKVLALHWQPIVRDHVVCGLLLMARDMTLHRLHDQMRQQQHERMQAMTGLVSSIMKSSRMAVENFLRKGLQKLQDVSSDDTQAALFELHTLKGVARSLGLKDIAVRIHTLESSIKTTRSREFDSMIEGLLQYMNLNLQMMHEIGGGPGNVLNLQNLYDVASHSRLNLFSLLEKHRLELEAFVVDDAVIGWDATALELISEAMQHAITNSIDHGFVFPRLQQQRVSPKVRLELRSWLEARDTVIEFRDNGHGVDDAILQSLARTFGLDLSVYENPLDMLFEAGISSTQTVSLTSGRGVGTSAIRAVAAKLKGSASFRRNPDCGLTLRVVLPRETSLYSTYHPRIGKDLASWAG